MLFILGQSMWDSGSLSLTGATLAIGSTGELTIHAATSDRVAANISGSSHILNADLIRKVGGQSLRQKSGVRLESTGIIEIQAGELDRSGTGYVAASLFVGQPVYNDVVSVTSVQPNGAIRLSDGIYAWAAKLERTVVAADLNGSDGQTSVNVVFRTSSSRTVAQLAGGYRVGFAATGALATSLNGRSAALVTSYLQLNANGSFALYDLGQYDAGGRTPTGSGQWQLAGDTVTLLQSGGRSWTYAVSADNVSLIPRFTAQGSGQQDVLCGLATLVAAPTRSQFSVARNGQGAGSRLYTLEDSDQWRSVDLVAKAGGPTITGKVVTWTDPKDGFVYAAAQAGSSLSLYRHDANGTWSRRDLRSTTPGAQIISSNLDFMAVTRGSASRG